MGIDYDRAAEDYARHRQVHPRVLQEFLRAVDERSRVLEVGCGTGNYILALAGTARCQGWGVDPSERMLERALHCEESVRFSLGRGENLDFPRASFDLVFSVDVIHHVMDRPAYFSEAHRVLQGGGKLCTVTDSTEIILGRIPLSRYFPETVRPELLRYPRISELVGMMRDAGFADICERTVQFRYDLCDFDDLAPYRDRAFSSLHLIADPSLQRGIRRMQRDLEEGPIRCVSRYCMLWGVKHQAEDAGGFCPRTIR